MAQPSRTPALEQTDLSAPSCTRRDPEGAYDDKVAESALNLAAA